MVVKSRFWKLIPTTAVGAIAFTLSTETATAFFPPVPIGSGPVTVSPPPPPPVNIPTVPTTPVSPTVPPVPPPPFFPPPVPTGPTTVPPPVPPCVCTPPQSVPEPATIVSGFIGLAVLGGVAWKRRAGEKPTES
jgi:hypothetical protein